ncbi:MAG: SLOG family protein [Oscillospiraceae bacterium]
MNCTTTNSCCFTGYRPQKFPFSLTVFSEDYKRFTLSLGDTIYGLYKSGIRNFYYGAAYGFDIIAAEAVVQLKTMFDDINLIAVVPFLGQEKMWDVFWQQRYNKILELSDEKIVVSTDYHGGAYQIRNRYMVDRSGTIVAFSDGKRGGTQNTINYALSQNKKVINIWSLK